MPLSCHEKNASSDSWPKIRRPQPIPTFPGRALLASIGLHIQGFTCAGCGETAGETAAIRIIRGQIGQILPGRTGTFLKRGRYVSAKNCFLEKLRNSHIDPNGKFQYRSCEHERESKHRIIINIYIFIIYNRQNSPFSYIYIFIPASSLYLYWSFPLNRS